MFSIGFIEVLVVAVVALLVMGPERLPGAVRETTLWVNRIRRYVRSVKQDLEEQMDDLENEQVFADLQAGRQLFDDAQRGIKGDLTSALDLDEAAAKERSQP